MRTSEPLRAIRLTSRVSGKPRPIKLEFEDEATKWEFLKRTNASLRNKNIFCKLDESKEVRDEQYKLHQTIKEMKDEKPDVNFRIRNNRIQSKGIEGEWRYVNTDRTGHSLKLFAANIRSLEGKTEQLSGET